MRIYIWGTGGVASDYLETNEVKDEELEGFIESKRRREFFHGKKVYEPCELVEKSEYDYIFVCVNYCGKEIYDTCLDLGIDVNKLAFVDNWEWSDGTSRSRAFENPCCRIRECGMDIGNKFPKLDELIKEHDIRADYVVARRNASDFIEKDSPLQSASFQQKDYKIDYFRYRTFELTVNEILRRKVDGNVAELGVFRGVFARLINVKFRDRKLYLFDTFESFDSTEFAQELEAGRCRSSFYDIFKNTGVEDVLAVMPYPNQCIVRKGLFPDTSIGLEEERYAFVSIDVDFEKSILEGLRYFYPRLNKGGAIFIHDFNSCFLGGVRAAVESYEAEIGNFISRVPLADEGGTLVVVK